MSAELLAERYVIGALLQDPTVLRSVQAECVPGDFEDLRLAAIYAGIVTMVAERQPVDYLTVYDQLASWDVRGLEIQALAEWAQNVPTTTNAAYYGKMVRDSASLRAIRDIGARLLQADDPGIAMSKAFDQLRMLRDHDTAGVGGVTMLGEILDVPVEEDVYDWTIPGLLERRDRFMLTGSEGGGKSTLLRQLALMAAAGLHPFSRQPIPPMRVLVVDVENSERQWRRAVRDLVDFAAREPGASGDPRQTVGLACIPSMDIRRSQDLGAIHRRIDQVRPDIVLIGPLYKMSPKGVNNDEDAAPVLAAMDSIRDRNVTMLIEAHAGHADSKSGVRDLRPRGSSQLLGWPEFGMGIAKPTKPGDPFELRRWRGDREERYWPPQLTSKKTTRDQVWPWEPVTPYWRVANANPTII